MLDMEVYTNKKNGYGIEIIYGPNGIDSPLNDDGNFTEFDSIISTARQFDAVRVQGQPGAGKSEILTAIHLAAYREGISSLFLKSHINGGNYNGLQNIRPMLEDYLDHTKHLGGLILLDNLDFIGYKGKRTRVSATNYSTDYNKFLGSLTNRDDRNILIATTHTDEWRNGNWQWESDSPIISNAVEIIDQVKPIFDYGGLVTKDYAIRTLASRIIDEQMIDPTSGYLLAQSTVDALDSLGLANYKYTKLLASDLILGGRIVEAITNIKTGTEKINSHDTHRNKN